MKGVIDRIEDSKIAVIMISGGGSMMLPVEQIGFDVQEGSHLVIELTPDPDSRSDTQREIKEIQDRLLKEEQGKEINED